MRKKISQREAARLKSKVKELEDKLRSIKSGWGGTKIHLWSLSDVDFARIKTAEILGRTIVLHSAYTGTEVRVMAIEI